MGDLVFYSASELAQGIRDRTFSAVEVLESHLAHITRHNPALNAIVTLNESEARLQAKAADEAVAAGQTLGPLHGVPVTFKDLFETAGLRTTFGYKSLAQYIPPKDVPLVARLRAAGAIVLGKTNVPKGSTDIQTVNPIFGRTNNPWDLTRTPGGSTGGGGAAIAAGLSPLELGNDLGCSLRMPAHLCGVYSLKPTEHRVANSLRSNPRLLRHMISTGPMARSVADLKLCLEIIEGPDGTEWEVSPLEKEAPIQQPLSKYRIAWCDRFEELTVDTQTQSAIQTFAATLSAAGCQVERATPPNFDFTEAWETFGELCVGQIAQGQTATLRGLASGMTKLLPSGLIPSGALGRGFVRGVSMSLQDYMTALSRRDRLIGHMEQFLSQWDAWLCPVAPGPAFTHRQTWFPLRGPLAVDDRRVSYWMWGLGFSSIFNLTGNPVVTLPISTNGLPIGVQLVGQRWQDRRLLAIAQSLSELTAGFRRPPGY
ncbi:amidase [Altericista sp. CCNU0014]|uniref:amidase n=1 Tax=Altericista sp. CCNU0014 TaxID=3082949 RepID=UPI00384AC081